MLVVLSQQDTQLMFLKPAYAEVVVTNVKISIVWGCIFVSQGSKFLGAEKKELKLSKNTKTVTLFGEFPITEYISM